MAILLLNKLKQQVLVKDLAILFIDRCMQLVGQVFNIFILTHYLGATKFGVLMYSISLYGFLWNVSSLGMERVLVVELSRTTAHQEKNNLLLTGGIIKLVTSIATISLLFLGQSYTDGLLSEQVYAVVCLLSWGVLFSFWQVIDAYNQSIGKFKNTALARIISVLLILAAKSYFVIAQASFHTIVVLFAIEQLLCLLLCFCLSPQFIKHVRSIRLREFSFQKRMLKSGAFVMISTSCVLLYFRTSQVVIENRFSGVYLGLFSLVIYLVEMPVSLASIMSTVFTPKLSQLYSINKTDTKVEQARILLVFLAVSIMSMLVLVVVGAVLSHFLNNEYDGFYRMLLQSLIAIPLIFIGYFSYMTLLTSKKFKQYLLVTLFGGLGALLYLYTANGYYTTSNAVYLYVTSQFIASFLIPVAFQKELRACIRQVFFFVVQGSMVKQLKAVNNLFK